MKEAEVGNTISMIKEIRYMSLKEINILPKSNLLKRLLFLYLQKNRRKMKLTKIITLGVVGLSVFVAAQQDKKEKISDKNLKKNLYFLASDKLEGRLAGSESEKKSAQFLYKNLKSYGLKSEIIPFEYTIRLDKNSEVLTKIFSRNVVGYLDNGAKQTIIIGAHYDHLGYNEHHNSTMPEATGQIHNGADDNASGVSAVLELARIFSQNKTKENANFIFVLFSGEEDGLMGSKYFAEGVKSKYPNPIAMINLDMVGRLDNHKNLTIGGIGTSPLFQKIVEKFKPEGMQLVLDNAGQGPSDHTSFYLQDIPVLFFFTGIHPDYHKPTDDAQKINYEGLKIITKYVFDVAKELTYFPQVPFTKTTIPKEQMPEWRVSMGVMPSLATGTNGMKIEGVTERKPAYKAGIMQGDVLKKLDDCTVEDIYSYTKCLSKYKAKDTAEATIQRGDKIIIVKLQF